MAPRPLPSRSVIRTVFALALGAVAIHHARLAWIAAERPLRHLVFAVIDGLVAVLVARAPRMARVVVPLLFAQQLTSHGAQLYRSATSSGPLDIESLAVLAFFAALLIVLLAPRTANKRVHRGPT